MGARIQEGDIRRVTIPRVAIQPGAVTKAEDAIGMVVLAPVAKGEQILANKMRKGRLSLATAVPPGKRAVAVAVDHATVLELIEPGDWVDVLATLEHMEREPDRQTFYTVTLVQNVQVVAVGRRFRPASREERPAEEVQDIQGVFPSVNLALSPEEAELVALAEARGRLKLTVRAVGDTQKVAPRRVNFSSLVRSFRATRPPTRMTLRPPTIFQGVE